MLRRLRSMLPVSPLPWRWHRRLRRGALAAIVLLAGGGAIASVLIQRGSESESAQAPAPASMASMASKEAKRALNRMSLRQQADAVVVPRFGDLAAAESELASSQLGGVLVGPEEWASGGAEAVSRLRRAGSGRGRVPPLIVAAQEGGAYRAYPDLPPEPGALEIGDLGDAALAESTAEQAGRALKQAGFDLNLAPVADVATLDSPVSDRAYGDDPELVAALTAAAVRGCGRSGLGCAVAHFPGLGGASEDTGNAPATVSLDAPALEARDLAPFRAAFEAGAPATVLSLAFYAAYDPVTPAALSPRVATALLRSELGFEGVAITDDLTAGAIAAGMGAPQAAVAALAAGSDLVVVGDPTAASQARTAILASARAGVLSRDRLEQAVLRVLDLKKRLGLL